MGRSDSELMFGLAFRSHVAMALCCARFVGTNEESADTHTHHLTIYVHINPKMASTGLRIGLPGSLRLRCAAF